MTTMNEKLWIFGITLFLSTQIQFTNSKSIPNERTRRQSNDYDEFDDFYHAGSDKSVYEEDLYENYEEEDTGEVLNVDLVYICSSVDEQIPLSQMCNGVTDCSDGSDEILENCQRRNITPAPSTTTLPPPPTTTKATTTTTEEPYDETCTDDEILCDNMLCLPKFFVCDGLADCDDGSDEANCPDGNLKSPAIEVTMTTRLITEVNSSPTTSGLSNSTTVIHDNATTSVTTTAITPNCESEHLYSCKSRKSDCIPASLICDGYADCLDGSDEIGCPCKMDEYTCVNGDCIPQSKTCDGKFDCIDFSDELLWCNNLLPPHVLFQSTTTGSSTTPKAMKPNTTFTETTIIPTTLENKSTTKRPVETTAKPTIVSATTMNTVIFKRENKTTAPPLNTSADVATTNQIPKVETHSISTTQIHEITNTPIKTTTDVDTTQGPTSEMRRVQMCTPQLCMNGRVCKNIGKSKRPSCECSLGFMGKFCEKSCTESSVKCSSSTSLPSPLVFIMLAMSGWLASFNLA